MTERVCVENYQDNIWLKPAQVDKSPIGSGTEVRDMMTEIQNMYAVLYGKNYYQLPVFCLNKHDFSTSSR